MRNTRTEFPILFAYLADFAVEGFSRSVTGDGTGPRRSH